VRDGGALEGFVDRTASWGDWVKKTNPAAVASVSAAVTNQVPSERVRSIRSPFRSRRDYAMPAPFDELLRRLVLHICDDRQHPESALKEVSGLLHAVTLTANFCPRVEKRSRHTFL